MKLYRNNNIRIIDIEIVVEYSQEYLAAARIIEHLKNIKKRKRISSVKLQILNDFAASIISRVENSPQFEVTRQTPPGKNKSYSYYIQFDVYDKDGNILVPVGIISRVSTHPMHGRQNEVGSGSVVIRSFVLKGKHYENSVEIILTVNRICSELEKGNIKILDEYAL